MDESKPLENIGERVEALASAADLGWVATALRNRRDQVLARWLEVAAAQPFHAARPERAVADAIPKLYDALLLQLEREAPRWVAASPPLADPAVLEAAAEHAVTRAEQGLEPAEVVAEFRLLRQEIWAALRNDVPASAPTGDVVAGQLLVNDALDGATSLALASLAARLDALREDFLATTVHDIRQPISVLRGSAQLAIRLLQRQELDLPRIRQQLERIESTSGRMADLLATLIDSSRAAVGQLDVVPRPTDLRALLETVANGLEPGETDRLRIEVEPGLETSGEWDPSRLHQLFTNLLSNAQKYSPPMAPIEVRLAGDEHRLRVSVRDHGIGLSAADLGRLFQRYVRTRSAQASQVGGLGLGLYLSRAIALAHGGRIWAESAGPGLGATFTVELPRRFATVRPAAKPD